jgi:predicted RNA binding protein YcfA (HicA-like mRNA interferase family)
LAARNSDKVITSLKKKGFKQLENDHHSFYPTNQNGERIIGMRTKVSHGSKHDIGDDLLKQMARQTGLSLNEFLKLIDCTIDKEKYLELLGERGLVG